MEVRQAFDEYCYAVIKHSPKTQICYTQKLTVFLEWCEQQRSIILLEHITAKVVRRFIEHVSKRINPRTRKPISSYTLHGYAQVIKGFLNWCANEEGIEDVVNSKTPGRIDMPKVEIKVIEIFTPEQIQALFVACAKEEQMWMAVRNKAILSVLLDTGVRASELCSLTLDCLFLSHKEGYLKVYGKGGKWREVGLGNEARAALNRYITRYRRADKGEQHVFVSRWGEQLTASGLSRIISRIAERTSIKGVRASAHTFRHTFAINFIGATGDIYRLSRLLGHTSVSVTENYLRSYQAKDARSNSMSVLDRLR